MLRCFKQQYTFAKLNVTDQTSINKSYNEVKNHFSFLDVLINNTLLISGGKSVYYQIINSSSDNGKVGPLNKER